MVSVEGGGNLGSETTAMLTILENDAPIRFTQSEYRVAELDGAVILNITRGQLENGTYVGPSNVTTDVTVTTMNGTASPGQDYTTQQTVVTFPAGSTSMNVMIIINDDVNPECEENFLVMLSNPGSSSVLSSPSTTMVIIEVSDITAG